MCVTDILFIVIAGGVFAIAGTTLGMIFQNHQKNKKTREYIENGKKYKD